MLRHFAESCWWCYKKVIGITIIIRIHPVGNMKICSEFYSNLSNRCQPHDGVRGKVGDHQI